MSEATRLEQSLSTVERERFDLGQVARGCVEGYRLAHPGSAFEVAIDEGEFPVDGSPDLAAQMLDKLVDNAVEFSLPGAPIRFDLRRDGPYARLAVSKLQP